MSASKARTPPEKAKLALLGMQRYSWEQGVAMQAFLEQGDGETVIALALEAVHRRSPDGRCAQIGNQNAVTDPCACGEGIIAALKATGDPALKEGLDALLEWALEKAPRNEKGLVYHLDNKPQIWVDSFYMLPPFLAAAGCYQQALLNAFGYWEILFDGAAKLLRHIWDDGEKAFVRGAFWGVGNGWALASFARLYDLLPGQYCKEKDAIRERAITLIDSALGYMRDDFLFHDVLNDTSTFVETNFTQMLAYTIFRGITSGWLDASYRPAAENLRAAANGKVDHFGLVQGVCGAPDFSGPGVAPEGQAFYLLMEAAAENKLVIRDAPSAASPGRR